MYRYIYVKMKSTGVTSKTDCPLGQQEPLEVILEMLGDEDEVQEEEEEEEELENENEYGMDVGEIILVEDQGEAVNMLQELGIENEQDTEGDHEVDIHETHSEDKEHKEDGNDSAVEEDEYHPEDLRDEISNASPQEISEAEVAEEATAETVMRHEGPLPLTRKDMTSLTNRRASLTQCRFKSFDEGGGDETYLNEERELKFAHSLSSEGAHQSISSSSDSNQTVIEFDTRGGSVTSVDNRKLSDLGRSSTDDSVANIELDSVATLSNVSVPVDSTPASDDSQMMEDVDLSFESKNQLEEDDYLSAVENSIEALDAMEWENTASIREVKRYIPPQRQAFKDEKSLSSSLEEEVGKADQDLTSFLRDDTTNNAGDSDRKENTNKERIPEEKRQYSVLDPDYIERENRKIQQFIDSLYECDETNKTASQDEDRNASESGNSADSCLDALDLLSKSSRSSDSSSTSPFRSVKSVQNETRNYQEEADHKSVSSAETQKISDVKESREIRRASEEQSLIEENNVTESEAKLKNEVTDKLSVSPSETFPTLRRSRSRERSKSPLEERKSFSEFSSPQHERVASTLKYFDRSESPIGRCRSLSPINIRLERIHRVHLKPLTSHSLNLSLERIHKINLPPLAAFSHSASDDIATSSGEKLRKFDKENIEYSKQASVKEEQERFGLKNEEELRNLGFNNKTDAEKQEIIRYSKQENIGEEPQQLEMSIEESKILELQDTTAIVKQESSLTNSTNCTLKEDEVEMQQSYSDRENGPSKLGTLKRSNTIDFRTDVEAVGNDLERFNVEQLASPRENLVTKMKSLTNGSDEVEKVKYTKVPEEKDVKHHDQSEKSEEEREGMTLPLYRSSHLATLVSESKSFDSGPSVSDEEGDPQEYIDPRVEDWVQHVDRGMGVSLDDDTSGSEVMKEEETSSKTDEDEDDHGNLPHFYDSDGTTPVAEIRHLPGELFTQDSHEEAEKRELWRSISQSTTPPNSPVTSPPPSFQYEDIISQQPESELPQRGEDLIMFSEESGASSVVSSIHHNVSDTLLPNLHKSDAPFKTEVTSHSELLSEDSFMPMNSKQVSSVSLSQDFENNGKGYFSGEESQKERRRFGDGPSDDYSCEDESLQEISNHMNMRDTYEHTDNYKHPRGSESGVRSASLTESVDKVALSKDDRSEDSKFEEESLQEYRSYCDIGRGRDKAKGEESPSKPRRAPVVTAGGNLIYYEEDTKEYEHDKYIIDAEHSMISENSSHEQGNDGRRGSVSGEELFLKDESYMDEAASHYISDQTSHETGSNRSTENELKTILPLEANHNQDSVSEENTKEYEHDRDISDGKQSTLSKDFSREQGSDRDMNDRRESVSGKELLQKDETDMDEATSHCISDQVSHETGSNRSTPENELQTILPLKAKHNQYSVSEEDIKEYEHDKDIDDAQHSTPCEDSSREQENYGHMTSRRRSLSEEELLLKVESDMDEGAKHDISDKESCKSDSKRSIPENKLQKILPWEGNQKQYSVSDRILIDNSSALNLFLIKSRSDGSEGDTGDSVCKESSSTLSKGIRNNRGRAYSLESTFEKDHKAIFLKDCKNDGNEKECLGITYSEASHDGSLVTSRSVCYNGECPTATPQRFENIDSDGDLKKPEDSFSTTAPSEIKRDAEEDVSEIKECLSLVSSKIQYDENLEIGSDNNHDEESLMTIYSKDGSDQAVLGYSECTNLEESLITISNTFRRVMDVVNDTGSLQDNDTQATTSSKFGSTTGGIVGESHQGTESVATVSCKRENDTKVVISDEFTQEKSLTSDTDRIRTKVDLLHGLDSLHDGESLVTMSQKSKSDFDEIFSDESIRDKDSVSSVLCKSRNSIDAESSSDFIHDESSVTKSQQIRKDADITASDFAQESECHSITYVGSMDLIDHIGYANAENPLVSVLYKNMSGFKVDNEDDTIHEEEPLISLSHKTENSTFDAVPDNSASDDESLREQSREYKGRRDSYGKNAPCDEEHHTTSSEVAAGKRDENVSIYSESVPSQEYKRSCQVIGRDQTHESSMKPEKSESSMQGTGIRHGMYISDSIVNTEEEIGNRKKNDEMLIPGDCSAAYKNEKIEANVDFIRYCKDKTENEDDHTNSDERIEKSLMSALGRKMKATGDSPEEDRSAGSVFTNMGDSYNDGRSKIPIDDSSIHDNDECASASATQQADSSYNINFFIEEPTRVSLIDRNKDTSDNRLFEGIGNNQSQIAECITETKCHESRKVDRVPAMMETDYSKFLLAAECHNVSLADKTEDDFDSLPSDEKASEDCTSILHDSDDVVEEESDKSTVMEENINNLPDEDDKTIRSIDGAELSISENFRATSPQQVDNASLEVNNDYSDINTRRSFTTELDIDNEDEEDEEEEGDDDEEDDGDENERTEDSDDLTTADDTSRSDDSKEDGFGDEENETMTRSSEERTPTDESGNSPGDTGDEQDTSHRAGRRDDHCWTIKAEVDTNSDDSQSTLSNGEQVKEKTGKCDNITGRSETKEELNVKDKVDKFESHSDGGQLTGSKLSSENENHSSGYHSADESNPSLSKSDAYRKKKLNIDGGKQTSTTSGDTVEKKKFQEGAGLASCVAKSPKTVDTGNIDKKIGKVILENKKCYFVTLTFLERLNDRLKFSDQSAATAMPSKITITTTKTQQPDAVSSNTVSRAQRSTDAKSVSALHLAAEGRDYLMWCPDRDFDRAVSTLDVRGLVDLVQTLQDAMAVEQQTFDSLTQQLELVEDPLVQQRLSAALCTSQTRLARLCSRNMRCFTQQALKARQKDESRSSSPRDSGLVVSSSGGVSDFEGDPRSPTTASFKNSLAFFQRAANVVATNSRSAPTEARKKDPHRRSSRGSSTCTSGSEDLSTGGGFIEDVPAGGDFVGRLSYLDGGGGEGVDGGGGYGEDEYDLGKFEDHGTYEQVLFINGRPQYQGDAIHGDLRDERCGMGEPSDRSSSTRVRIDGSTGRSLVLQEASDVVGGGGGGGGDRGSDSGVELTPAHSVANYSSLPRRAHARARKGASAAAAEDEPRRGGLLQEQREQPQVSSDLGGYVTLPRRKPYLNLRSVSCGPSPGSAEFDNDDLSYFKEKVGISRSSSAHAITRTQSCKEGLNRSSEFYNNSAYGLSRTQSFNDGLAGDFNAIESVKPKLQRAPSVDEILESVKSLRAKKNMVKSTPDLVGNQDSSPYHSASLTRHKGKTHRASGSASSLLGVRYNGASSGGDPHYDRVPEPDYEQIRESSSASSAVTLNPYYENLVRDNYYENVHPKGEVIYDNPRPTEHHYDRVHNDIHYENLDYDDPVYESVHEKEPTYMNVSDSSTLSSTSSSSSSRSKSKVYANLEPATGAQQKGSASSGKAKGKSRGKVTVTGGSSVVEGLTYDVPRAATHIYDSPQKQIRSVMPTAAHPQASEYDTPKSNRSVLPQSTQIVLQAKNEQKQRIDDIFADCDQDSLDGHDREPDIPSPDYGSEEESETLDEKKVSTKDSFASSELPDEGLGDSDSRSYYTEEQGLEVILEEPEEEYCSSATSEDDLQRDVDITHELKGERRSLDGSEGIGSAEGDCHSSGGSEHYAEEDCASSGIHSQDTPSPGPPVEDHSCDKDDLIPRSGGVGEEERIQKDRCVEVYPETVRQRQRNSNMSSNNKVDIKNWTSSSNKGDTNSPSKVKKFLPSVKALRNQFETGKTTPVGNGTAPNSTSTPAPTLSRKSSSSTSSLASSTLEKTSSTNSLASTENGSTENLLKADIRDFAENGRTVIMDPDEPVEPIFNQFKSVDEELKELMSKPPSTTGWNPLPLLKRLYYVPEAPKMKSEGTTYINIEGYLEKLPSGRKKATFWNAWKRRYFIAKDGVLYYYQNNQTEKPSMKLPLMGGKVECMEPNMVGVDDGAEDDDACGFMIGVDDGKGHYVVVRCSSRQEAERWRRALETHTVEDFTSQYVQPWPVPTNPALLRDTLVVDLGSCSIRAGVLASNPTLPQLFFPCVVATQRDNRRQTWGLDALDPDVRSSASVSFPIRPSHKITKYSVDLSAVSSLLQKTFADLKVDPKNYNLQLSVPRVLNSNTQVELLKILFDKFGCRSVNLTHQSILSLYAYNATSGIVVDLGERMDIVPVIDGYIVDGGVSRVPYGGYRILDHLRQFLYMRNVSLVTEVEGYILRYVLEKLCYCAQHYNTEKARCTNNPDNFEKSVSLSEFFQGRDCPYETISLDFGRFQSTEGIFNPDAWGLDHPGLHKLVHKAIQECSMDIRKEMSRSIFLVGGASQLPGLADRLTTELDNLTPPAIRPKVHCSPHRYHAAYLGACVLADSAAFQQSRITREDWNKYGNASIRKWSL